MLASPSSTWACVLGVTGSSTEATSKGEWFYYKVGNHREPIYIYIYIYGTPGLGASRRPVDEIPVPGGTFLILAAFLYMKRSWAVFESIGFNEQVRMRQSRASGAG